jgi:hypothetical protein
VSYLALSYIFFILSHKRYYFREGGELLIIKYVFGIFLQHLPKTFPTLRTIQQDVTKMCTGLRVKSSRYSFQILVRLEFCRQILRKILKYQFFFIFFPLPEICPVGTELFCADRQKYRRTWRSFAKAPNKMKIEPKWIGCEDVDWSDMAQDKDNWWTVLGAVMNLRTP